MRTLLFRLNDLHEPRTLRADGLGFLMITRRFVVASRHYARVYR